MLEGVVIRNSMVCDNDFLTFYRPCNCDAEDGKLRKDAGVFNNSYKLPMKELLFSYTGNPLSIGTVTLGNLYCANSDFGN